jgi:TolA-binding protein
MLQQFPNGKYSDNANYWIGESYFASEDYALAITFFEKVLTFKGSLKTDDARFKIGISYLKMGKPGAAREVFIKHLDQDPGNEYAPRIKRYLKQLK